jgi:hypothetical protein
MPQYATSVEALLATLDAPSGPEEAACRDRAAAAARELRARAEAPVTVAVVGEYSVGKSLLLGTLLGRPDLLAVEERPTTGNITVLRLAPGEPGSRTRLAPRTLVHYMSRGQLSDCVREILRELATTLDEQHPELRAGELLGHQDPLNDPQGWAEFTSWYPCLWGVAVRGLPQVPAALIAPTHRDAAVELCRIRDAVHGQQNLIDAGPVELDTGAVRSVLQLPQPQPTPDRPPRAEVLRFSREDVTGGGQALQASFPLVERVEQKVLVSPDDWDIGGLLREHEVQFLDFPGIGAAASYGRDKNLSRRELVSVHTILLVLLAKRAQSRNALAFWEMLAADGRPPEALAQAALVAANLFDEVAVPVLPTGPLPLERLLPQADAVSGIHTYAGKYVGKRADRVLAVSAIAAVEHYGLDYTEASPATRQQIDLVRTALRHDPLPRWHRVADQLASADPGSDWARRLRAFDHDGGVAALRSMLESHVREHGVAQKLERAERSRQKLDTELRALRRLLNQGTTAPPEEYQRAAKGFAEIRELFERISRQLDSLREQYPVEAPEGPPPPGFTEATRQVRDTVYGWPEWEQLLDRALNDPEQLVTRSSTPGADPLLPPEFQVVEEDEESSPDGTDVFLGRFEQLVLDATGRNLRAVQEWLDAWSDQWQTDSRPLGDWLASESDASALLLDGLYARRGKSARSLGMVRYALDLERLSGYFSEQLAAQASEYQREWAAGFPAQRHHALPWHHRVSGASPVEDRRTRHPLAVVQLRAYLAEAAAALVNGHLDQLIQAVAQGLSRVFRAAGQALLAEEEFRAPSDAEEPESPQPAPGPVQAIDDILREGNEGAA